MRCSSRGRNLARCWLTSRRTVNGKPSWLWVTSSGSCTRTSRCAGTYVRLRWRAPTVHIVARRRAHQNYLLYLEEDVTEAVANARRLGVCLGAVCADVVESLNAILKRAYNDHSGGGGGEMMGATQLEREAKVVSQLWEWWFLQFDLPLRNYGTPHTAPCTMAKLMATRSPAPSTLASPPPALFSPCHGRVGNAKDFVRHVGSQQSSPGVFSLCTLAFVVPFMFGASLLIFRD